MTDPIPFVDFGGQGPVLHFAHANAYPPGCYRQFIDPLRAHYHVLAMEQRPLWPGHAPEELDDWHTFAGDLVRFFEQRGVQNVIGVGHSLGAVVTMSAAVSRPGLFRALVLIEPVFLLPHVLDLAAANPDAAYDMPLVQKALNRRHRWPIRQAAFNRFRTKSVFARFSDSALWDYVEHGTVMEESGNVALRFPREWEAQIYANPPTDVWDLIPQVTQPTLAVRGAESKTLLPEAWSLWQDLQPQATFVEVPETTHLLTMEAPIVLANEILAQLEEPAFAKT